MSTVSRDRQPAVPDDDDGPWPLVEAPEPTRTRDGALYRLNRAQLDRLIAAGVLPGDGSVALRRGLLIDARHPGGTPYPLSLEQYEAVTPVGAIDGEAPVILLDGLLVTKMSRGELHIGVTRMAQELLRNALPLGWFTGKEDPIVLPAGPSWFASMPEPDGVVLRGTIRDYFGRRPFPEDIGLVIEVADSTIRKDRRMLVRYARAGIPVAWLIRLKDRDVEVHTDPTGPDASPRYRTIEAFPKDREIPLILDGAEVGRIAVRDLFP